MTGNGWKWMQLAGNGYKWLEIAEIDGYKRLSMFEPMWDGSATFFKIISLSLFFINSSQKE